MWVYVERAVHGRILFVRLCQLSHSSRLFKFWLWYNIFPKGNVDKGSDEEGEVLVWYDHENKGLLRGGHVVVVGCSVVFESGQRRGDSLEISVVYVGDNNGEYDPRDVFLRINQYRVNMPKRATHYNVFKRAVVALRNQGFEGQQKQRASMH